MNKNVKLKKNKNYQSNSYYTTAFMLIGIINKITDLSSLPHVICNKIFCGYI